MAKQGIDLKQEMAKRLKEMEDLWKKEKEEAEVQNQVDQAEVTDSKIRRKSFGRMFWVPDGCDRDKIEAKAKKIYSYLNLEISVPRSTSVPEKTTGGADSNKTINIPIIVL